MLIHLKRVLVQDSHELLQADTSINDSPSVLDTVHSLIQHQLGDHLGQDSSQSGLHGTSQGDISSP